MTIKSVLFGARRANGTGLGAREPLGEGLAWSKSAESGDFNLTKAGLRQMPVTIPLVRNSISRSPLRRGFLLIAFAILWFALSPAARAVSPAPDGGYPGANTAEGESALLRLTTGIRNTANGSDALRSNTTGRNNTATGVDALVNNTTGGGNTAISVITTTGGGNSATIALSNSNIYIGNNGIAGESNKIRIGTVGVQNATFIAGIRGSVVPGGVGVVAGLNGQLGTVISSARFKEAIKPMDKASEAILALKPVTFRYKHALDPEGIPQFGLVAEQVEKVNPDLVARDGQGKVNTVRYEAVNAMLLNEFLKEHRKVQELEAAIAQQQKDFAQQFVQQQKDFTQQFARQQKEIQALAASLKALQIHKVSGQLGVNKPALQTAAGG